MNVAIHISCVPVLLFTGIILVSSKLPSFSNLTSHIRADGSNLGMQLSTTLLRS